jgi:hypothetical protein
LAIYFCGNSNSHYLPGTVDNSANADRLIMIIIVPSMIGVLPSSVQPKENTDPKLDLTIVQSYVQFNREKVGLGFGKSGQFVWQRPAIREAEYLRNT